MSATETKQKVVGKPALAGFPFPSCPGCQHPVVGRMVFEVVEELGLGGKAIVVIGVGCHGGPMFFANIDAILAPHGRAPDIATAAKRLRPDALVFTVQGDGDCVAIGAGPFIGALTRGEKFTTIMCNNTNYGTTGGQLAPTTVMGQVTSTTPKGRSSELGGYPIHTAELAATFRGTAYSARGALTTGAWYQRTKKFIRTAFEKQINKVGFSFVEVISACPPNWHLTPVECLEWIDEVAVKEFPLGEFKNLGEIT